MRRCILVLSALAAACGGDDTLVPQERVIATGTYAYEGRWLHPATLTWDTIRGQLLLDVATPDSIHGRWAVDGLRNDSTAGYWNENAYVIGAVSLNGMIRITNRLSRIGAPSQLLCALAFEEEDDAGNVVGTSGSCQLVYVP